MQVDLARLHGAALAALGARVRRIAEGQRWTTDQIARAIVDVLYDATAPDTALVRAYRVHALGALPAELAAGARGLASDAAVSDATRCLVLAATRGIEPAWNDVAAATCHRVIPLASEAAVRRQPMLAPLIEALHVPLIAPAAPARQLERANVFFVPDAVGDPQVPAQRELVLRHGVRSVVGFGGPMPDGDALVLVMFTRTAIPPGTVGELDIIGVHARLALLEASDRTLPPDVIAAVRARSLDELLRLQEYRFQRSAEQLVRDRDAEAARADVLRVEAGAQATRLQRSQRAMLNVIEDLRDARARLEQRVAERTAELEERNRELEQFAYIASHDLQEPLRTVSGYLQLIAQRHGARLDAEGHEFLAFAVTGARRMQELIEALLAYSRVASRAYVTGPVALDDVLDDVLRGLERAIAESGATIRRGALPVVRGDRVQLGQLLQNLVANAIKFAGDAPPEIAIEADPGDPCVIRVHDRGIGFDNRHAERIFLLFRRLQRTHPGTGIGLAICKKIVERHGGTIRASSVPGRGTTFELTLPKAAR